MLTSPFPVKLALCLVDHRHRMCLSRDAANEILGSNEELLLGHCFIHSFHPETLMNGGCGRVEVPPCYVCIVGLRTCLVTQVHLQPENKSLLPCRGHLQICPGRVCDDWLRKRVPGKATASNGGSVSAC